MSVNSSSAVLVRERLGNSFRTKQGGREGPEFYGISHQFDAMVRAPSFSFAQPLRPVPDFPLESQDLSLFLNFDNDTPVCPSTHRQILNENCTYLRSV